MARVAIRRRPGKYVVDMAARTRDIDMSARKRKRRLAVVKCGAGPRDGAVTHRTILGETSGHMVWIGRPGVLGEVTRDAGSRQSRVLPIRMTRRALLVEVRAGQRKPRFAVIESRPLPAGRRMTQRAVLRETGARMVRVRRLIVVREMAGVAGCRSAGIPVVDVALETIHLHVRAGKWEGGLTVVESRSLPAGSSVAERAILREAGRGVIGVCRLVEIREVTRYAVGGCSGEFVIHVTLIAGQGYVSTGQRELGCGVVIEFRSLPLNRGVADCAILRESCRNVTRIVGLVEIRYMAGYARRGSACKPVIDMALRTVDLHMRAC